MLKMQVERVCEKSLEKPWSAEGCGGVRGAGDDTWHKGRAGVVGLSPDAVTAIAEDVLMHFKDFVVSLSSPLSVGHCVWVPAPFSTCTKRGYLTELPLYLRAQHSLFLLLSFLRNRKNGE